MNGPLSNFLIQPNVVSKENCGYLIERINKSSKQPASIVDRPELMKGSVDKEVRDVHCADTSEILDELKDLLDNIVENIINPFYDFKVKDSEVPQLLHYKKGGHYKPHIDSEAPWKAPNGDILWKKCMDRDLSTILFLNDDFEGGDLVFPDLRIVIRPEPGLLLCFPSSAWYRHGVEPVISGDRYTMVTWMRVNGFPTQEEQEKMLIEKYKLSDK